MSRTFIHTKVTWVFSPIWPKVLGVTLGFSLCPWYFKYCSWRGARQSSTPRKSTNHATINEQPVRQLHVLHGCMASLGEVGRHHILSTPSLWIYMDPTFIPPSFRICSSGSLVFEQGDLEPWHYGFVYTNWTLLHHIDLHSFFLIYTWYHNLLSITTISIIINII